MSRVVFSLKTEYNRENKTVMLITQPRMVEKLDNQAKTHQDSKAKTRQMSSATEVFRDWFIQYVWIFQCLLPGGY